MSSMATRIQCAWETTRAVILAAFWITFLAALITHCYLMLSTGGTADVEIEAAAPIIDAHIPSLASRQQS